MSHVSVVIPTYRRAALVRDRSIPSILAQTHTDWDIHVVGDGTDDETADVVAAFADPRIRFTNIARQDYPADERQRWGLSGVDAMNHGWDTATGEWLWIFGDDDELVPDAMACLLAEASGKPVDVVYGLSDWWNAGGYMGVTQGGSPPGRGQLADGAALRRTALPYRYAVDAYARDMEADSDLWTRMYADGVRFHFVHRVVHRYWHWRPGYGG